MDFMDFQDLTQQTRGIYNIPDMKWKIHRPHPPDPHHIARSLRGWVGTHWARPLVADAPPGRSEKHRCPPLRKRKPKRVNIGRSIWGGPTLRIDAGGHNDRKEKTQRSAGALSYFSYVFSRVSVFGVFLLVCSSFPCTPIEWNGG